MRISKSVSAAAAMVVVGLLAATGASATDKTEPTPARQAGETARGAWDTTKETARSAWQVTKDTARQVWTGGKETAKDAWGATKEKTGEVTRDVKEGWKEGQK